MNRDDFERWIWRMVEALEDSSVDPLSDATLQAYQTRTLPAGERDRVDHALARSSEHRRRLIALAGDRVTQPPEQVWEKLRFRFTDRRGKGKGTWLRSPFAIAALAAVVVLSFAIWLWPGATRSSEFELARFEVQLEGASEVRSEVTTGAVIEGQRVRLRVESLTPAIDGLQYAIYRASQNELIRIPQESFERFESARGAAWIDVQVDRLAPDGVGTSTIYVVVGSSSPWPDVIELQDGEAEEALTNATRGKIYALPLDVRSADDALAD